MMIRCMTAVGLLLAVVVGLAADGPENSIKWSTASEVNNFGYDVYRADSEEGPFRKMTEDPIPGAGTVDTPTSYEFVDDTIAPETVYYYYVESISMDGERERFTPVFPSKPKPAPSVHEEG